MQDVFRFRYRNPFFHSFLAIFFYCLFAMSAQAQYRVGTCTGATHATLMDAYAAIQSTGLATGTTIEICPGTYLNQPITLTAITVATPGARLTITGMTGNPGDALFRITDPAQFYALKLDGARNIDFRNIMFDIEPHASRTTFRTVWADQFADDITFSNCLLEAPGNTPGSGADRSYAVAYLMQFDGDFGFYDCIFNGGAVGLEVNQSPIASGAQVNARRCTFADQERKAVKITSNFAGSKVDLRNNTLTSSNTFPYTGFLCEADGTAFYARNNTAILSNKTSLQGMEITSKKVEIRNNLFHLSDCDRLKGVYVHGENDDVVIERTHIYQLFPTLSTLNNLNEGIVFEGDYQEGFQSTQYVEIKQNIFTSELHYLGNGIRLSLNGGKIAYRIDVSDNRITFTDLLTDYSSACNGILIEGNSTEVKKTYINGNEIRFQPGMHGSDWSVNRGIVVHDLSREAGFTVLNNQLELGKIGGAGGRGIELENIREISGVGMIAPLWVGNNMISLEVNDTDIHGLVLADVPRAKIFHNSLHMKDGEPGGTGTPTLAALVIRETTPGSMHDIRSRSNIWSNESAGYHMDIACASCLTESDYNLFAPAGSFEVRYPGSASTVKPLSSWQLLSGLDASSHVGDPLFVSDNDLHLQGNASAAVNQAAFLNPSTVHATLLSDIDGDSRTTGDIPDIGADEYAGGNKVVDIQSDSPKRRVRVFPNPCQDFVTVVAAPGSQLQIMDLQGRILFSAQTAGDSHQLSLLEMPAGIYLLRIAEEGQPPQISRLLHK